MKRKVRMIVAAVCTIAVAGLFFKPDHVNVYAKSYGVEQVVISETVVNTGDVLMVPTAWETDGMHIYFFTAEGESLKNVTVDKGQNYTIPSYTATLFAPIPDGYKFAGWRVDGKPDDMGGNSWKLVRILSPISSSENTPKPTVKPTPAATEEPTDTPTPVVTEEPTPIVTEEPTPTIEPTPVVTEEPTPTAAPTIEPTPIVTEEPTSTIEPTPVVTEEPTPTAAPDVTEKPAPTPVVTQEPTPTPAPSAEPTSTPEPTQTPDVSGEDIDSTVIKSAGVYQLKPMIKYSLQGGVSSVEGDITHYANPIEFTVEAGGLFRFY